MWWTDQQLSLHGNLHGVMEGWGWGGGLTGRAAVGVHGADPPATRAPAAISLLKGS